ncbi:MAG: hypothetical protein KAU20_05935 [Nanoarchaeota archaeon]|nr:hypothetical protein [Nanoarchaeota archaeon]
MKKKDLNKVEYKKLNMNKLQKLTFVLFILSYIAGYYLIFIEKNKYWGILALYISISMFLIYAIIRKRNQ